VSDEAPPVPPAPETPKAAQPARPLAQALAQNLHAILVGAFTIVSSVVSALLGYYFAHEDRQNLLALEYDKIRVEHTLEIAKALVTAESTLQDMILVGQRSATRYCDVANRLQALKTDLAKVGARLPTGGTLNEMLSGLDPLIQSAGVAENVRLDFVGRLNAMKRDHEEMDKKILASWQVDDDTRKTLNGDTAATIRVYYRDHSTKFSELAIGYDKVSLAARGLILENGLCNLEPKWLEVKDRWIEWSTQAYNFTGSLSLELKPN
jgi:hypothetical protein